MACSKNRTGTRSIAKVAAKTASNEDLSLPVIRDQVGGTTVVKQIAQQWLRQNWFITVYIEAYISRTVHSVRWCWSTRLSLCWSGHEPGV